jgi:hypothetical protein
MQVKVVRRGGLAGIAMRGEVDTTSLPGHAAAAAQRALAKLPANKAAAPPSHPDSFQYELAYSEGGSARLLCLDESEISDDLQPVIDAAMENATIL